jgi:hypothetical protein
VFSDSKGKYVLSGLDIQLRRMIIYPLRPTMHVQSHFAEHLFRQQKKKNVTFERKQLTFRKATLICATFSVLCLVCNLAIKVSFILLFRVRVLC